MTPAPVEAKRSNPEGSGAPQGSEVKANGDEAGAGKRQKTEVPLGVKKAANLKAMYLDAISKSNSLLAIVVSDESWKSFNNKEQIEDIEATKSEVEKLVGTNAFFADFMLVDLKTLQAKTEASQLEANCIHMIAVMEASVRRLMNHANALLHMKLAKDTALASNDSLVLEPKGKAKGKSKAKARVRSAA